MRIGEITKDNYKDYARLLGVKTSKALDKMLGNDEQSVQRDFSHEACEARLVALGYIEEGELGREGDVSHQRIVPVPDSIRQAVIDKVREIFVKNGNGMATAKQGDEQAALAKSYWKTLPKNERGPAAWTLDKIEQAEAQRIGDYLKSQIPGWNWGQSFDTDILTSSNYGLGNDFMDIKV